MAGWQGGDVSRQREDWSERGVEPASAVPVLNRNGP